MRRTEGDKARADHSAHQLKGVAKRKGSERKTTKKEKGKQGVKEGREEGFEMKKLANSVEYLRKASEVKSGSNHDMK